MVVDGQQVCRLAVAMSVGMLDSWPSSHPLLQLLQTGKHTHSDGRHTADRTCESMAVHTGQQTCPYILHILTTCNRLITVRCMMRMPSVFTDSTDSLPSFHNLTVNIHTFQRNSTTIFNDRVYSVGRFSDLRRKQNNFQENSELVKCCVFQTCKVCDYQYHHYCAAAMKAQYSHEQSFSSVCQTRELWQNEST